MNIGYDKQFGPSLFLYNDDTVKDRFIDAIAFAVEDHRFYSRLAIDELSFSTFPDPTDPSHPYNGYIEKVDIVEPHYDDTLNEQIIRTLNSLVSCRKEKKNKN